MGLETQIRYEKHCLVPAGMGCEHRMEMGDGAREGSGE